MAYFISEIHSVKMRKQISVFVLVLVITLAFSKDLPADFKKCKRSDSDIEGCLKIAIQEALPIVAKGLPAFKLPVMEPLHIDKMTIGEGTGPVQVVQNYKDVDIYNMTKVVVTDVKAKLSDTDFFGEFDVVHEKMSFLAQYNVNGKILILPVVGEGPCTLELNNLKVKLTLIGKTEERKGKTYMKITQVKVHLNPEKVFYNFENLFNGDKQLGDAMNKVLNENNLIVFEDVRTGYEEFLSIVIKDIANKIFEHVPYDDLVPK